MFKIKTWRISENVYFYIISLTVLAVVVLYYELGNAILILDKEQGPLVFLVSIPCHIE